MSAATAATAGICNTVHSCGPSIKFIRSLATATESTSD
jgi:hypothetical protein